MTNSNSGSNDDNDIVPSDDEVTKALLEFKDTENLKALVAQKVQQITNEVGRVETSVSGLQREVGNLRTEVERLRAHRSSEAIHAAASVLQGAATEVAKTVYRFPRDVLNGTAQLIPALALLLALITAAAAVATGFLWSANELADQLPPLKEIAYRFEAGRIDLIPYDGSLYMRAHETVSLCKEDGICSDYIRVGVAP